MSVRPWHAVELGESQMGETRALFEQVFGHSMSEALWRWKYDGGRGCATGTRDEDGALLAHYGGTARTLVCEGQPLQAVQLGDVMVKVQARGILSRQGPFATATQAFLQNHIGSPGGFALGFGFPSARHTRLGEKLGLYTPLGEVLEVRWNTPSCPTPFWKRPWVCAPVDWSAAHTDARLDALWDTLRQTAQGFVLPQRDARWWRHRFANHPDGPYRCWWVRGRFSRRILGAVVLRPGQGAAADWELLDWLGAVQDAPTLLAAARELAAHGGARALNSWLSQPLVRHLQALAPPPDGAQASEQSACPYCVTQRTAPAVPAALRNQPWWLTGGDTDFR